MKFFFHITEVVEHYIDPNTGIPITVEQLQAMYQHQQQPEVMYTEDGQPIQQVWPQQQVRVPASSTSLSLFWSTYISWSIFHRDLSCMNSIVTCSINLTSLDLMFTLQVQQQYVNAEGQLLSVHQVDQHLVYSGVPQQQLLAQSVEVSGTHTQVAQIPGQQVYLQQVKLPFISLPYFSLSLVRFLS